MTELRKGDKVESERGVMATVEAISSDGRHLWLVDKDGDLSTYVAHRWTKFEPFFEKGKSYLSSFSGNIVDVHEIGVDSNGFKWAAVEGRENDRMLILREGNFEYYELAD